MKRARHWRRLGALARVVVSLFVSAWFVATGLAQAPPAVGDPAAPPTVTSHPDIGIVAEPLGSTSFTTMADGFPAPTVQWQVSSDRRGPWVDIPGATATTLSVTASEQPGDVFALGNAFRAVFTNHAGTAISRPARLVWKAQWMRDLGRDIAFVPLTELTIPGTHDMGTYGITGSSDGSTDGQDTGCGIAHTVCEHYGRAQDPIKDAEHQLNEGIRYFDLRVCDSAGGRLVTCHGLEAADLQDILDQTRAWIDSHPYEVVFLDFNHHYLLALDAEANQIEQAFALPGGGSLLIPPQYCTPGDTGGGICAHNLTLHSIAQQNLGRVIVNFQNDVASGGLIQPLIGLDFYDRHPLFWGRGPTPTTSLLCTKGSAVTSCFGNDPEVSVVLPRVRDPLANRSSFAEPHLFPYPQHFFVQFLATTPDVGYIANNLGGGLLEMAFLSNPVIGPAVLGCDAVNPCFGQFRPENLNILAINFYNRTDYKVFHALAPTEADECNKGLSSCPLTPEQLQTLSCIIIIGIEICTYYDPVHFDFVEEVIRFNAYARTAPVVEVSSPISPAATGWYNTALLGGQGNPLRVNLSAEDYRYPTGISALDCLDNTTFLSLTPGTNAPFARGEAVLYDGFHLLDCRATDGAAFGFHMEGNRGAGPGSTPAPVLYRVDTTPPMINCSDAQLLLNQPTTSLTATVTDATSGPATATVSAAISTSQVGSFSASLTAADVAGNTATAVCPYTVSYGIALRYDPTIRWNGGSTVPIRIELVDYFGTDVSDKNITVTAETVTNTGAGGMFAPTAAGNANPNSIFYLSPPKGYLYNLKTTGYASGAYTLDFVAGGDPLTHHSPFLIR